jgi:hypothetical protein
MEAVYELIIAHCPLHQNAQHNYCKYAANRTDYLKPHQDRSSGSKKQAMYDT